MKNLVLASILGSVATAYAVPALSGPVHFAITRPYSLFGVIPANPNSAPFTVALGTAPLDFVLTDVMFGGNASHLLVTVNGNPVFNCGKTPSLGLIGDTHMTSGIFIPAGSAIGVQGDSTQSYQQYVTLAGYIQ